MSSGVLPFGIHNKALGMVYGEMFQTEFEVWGFGIGLGVLGMYGDN